MGWDCPLRMAPAQGLPPPPPPAAANPAPHMAYLCSPLTAGIDSDSLQAFILRRNAQLLRNDAVWALFWLM